MTYREPLFRGKRIDNGVWIMGFYVTIKTLFGFRHRIYTGYEEEDNSSEYYGVIFKTVGQYTGIKDNHNAEIFEGDIVAITLPSTTLEEKRTIKGVVGFDEGTASFRIYEYKTKEDFLNDVVWDYHPIHMDIKIKLLSNIYDNPELLW